MRKNQRHYTPTPTLTCVNRRAWLVAGMCLLLVAAGAVAYARTRDACGDAVTSLPASKSSSPFLDAEQRAAQPDHDRDVLVSTLAGDPAPIGEVLGAVGYHYEQWAQVSAYAQGIGVRTRDNPDFTMLDDETLRPRWSVEVATKRSTYDASDKRYLVATMPAGAAPDLVALDADNGHRIWCASMGRQHGQGRGPVRHAVPRRRGRGGAGSGVGGQRAGRAVRRRQWRPGLEPDAGRGLRGLPRRHGRRHPARGRTGAVRAARPRLGRQEARGDGARAPRRQGRQDHLEAEQACGLRPARARHRLRRPGRPW